MTAFRWQKASGLSWRRAGWGVLFLILWAAVFYADIIPRPLNLQEGQLAPETIRAPRQVVDRVRTEQLRQEAAAAVPDVFDLDPRATAEAERAVSDAFARVREVAGQPGKPEEKAALLARELGVEDRAAVLAALAADPAQLDVVEAWARDTLVSVMQVGVREENLDAARQQVRQRVDALRQPRDLKNFAAEVAAARVRPNLVFNASDTEARRQLAREQVRPVYVQRGDVVLRKGELVTSAHLVLLRDLGLMQGGGNWLIGAGSLLLALLLGGILLFFLRAFTPAVWQSENLLVLVGLVLSVALVMGHLVRGVSGHLTPVATATVLLAVLVKPEVALISAPILAVGVAAINGLHAEFGITNLFGALVGAYAVGRISQRTDFLRAGFLAGMGQLGAAVALSLVGGLAQDTLAVWQVYLFSFLSGPTAGILAVGLLPFLETAFGVVTPIKLLELSSPNHPLLRRLLVEAPGTYHHSILVANLADAGAEAVGADGLLARVGAYYHDVGKIRRPYFFIENQMGQDNPHEKMSPALSAVVITAHVKDGLELAREYRLPPSVAAFIAEHHGDSLVSYFYSRAAENGAPVEEQGFRHQGPRPQSRETAIVMLADAVEAAVRALPDPTPAAIEGVVRRIIRERLQDRQLDQAPLTLRDLDRVAAAFVRVLSGIYHPRIEYPEGKGEGDEGKGRGDAGTGGDGAPRDGAAGTGGGGAGPGEGGETRTGERGPGERREDTGTE
ncbi:MAG: HDIG domain-containing protein [Firmicutes bacterium]|nr:HDIG domain-containing protein [Bacillota bacterium]